jgi:hypothetical protein
LGRYQIPAKNTEAKIDTTCYRTHHGSNWLVCMGKSILAVYKWLLITTNTRITP